MLNVVAFFHVLDGTVDEGEEWFCSKEDVCYFLHTIIGSEELFIGFRPETIDLILEIICPR